MSALSEARAHLRKAREFREAAENSLGCELYNAATSSAVTSGINAKDAICLTLTGTTGKSEHHLDAVAELRAAGQTSRPLAPTLGRLLKLKNKSQHQTVDVARADAVKAVAWAAALVEGASGIVPA